MAILSRPADIRNRPINRTTMTTIGGANHHHKPLCGRATSRRHPKGVFVLRSQTKRLDADGAEDGLGDRANERDCDIGKQVGHQLQKYDLKPVGARGAGHVDDARSRIDNTCDLIIRVGSR